MKHNFCLIFLLCSATSFAQSPGAAPYLAKIYKYNESSLFEDSRYTDLTCDSFYRLDAAGELVDPMNYDFDLMNAAIFFATNKYRTTKGLPPFKFDGRLRDAASIHSYEMVKYNFFDHMNYKDPALLSPDKRIVLCGYQGAKLAENIGRAYVDRGRPLTYTQLADKVVRELSKSKEHNRHLTDADMNELGCCVIFENKTTIEGVTYFLLTQDFGKDWK